MTSARSYPRRLATARFSAMSLGLVAHLILLHPAVAGPGAHGPNGEHVDGHPATATAASTVPRMEAQSELFELVARLNGGELSILIDRFATNEPVMQAQVEVESGALKAVAKFHDDIGDYAVDDAAMLKLLAAPGEHPLVITVRAGATSDLLDGVLRVGAGQAQVGPQSHDHGQAHDHGQGDGDGDVGASAQGRRWWPWVAGGVVAAVGAVIHWRRRRMPIASKAPTPGTDGGPA